MPNISLRGQILEWQALVEGESGESREGTGASQAAATSMGAPMAVPMTSPAVAAPSTPSLSASNHDFDLLSSPSQPVTPQPAPRQSTPTQTVTAIIGGGGGSWRDRLDMTAINDELQTLPQAEELAKAPGNEALALALYDAAFPTLQEGLRVVPQGDPLYRTLKEKLDHHASIADGLRGSGGSGGGGGGGGDGGGSGTATTPSASVSIGNGSVSGGGLRRVRFRKGRLGMDISPRLWVRSVAPNSQAEERGVEPYSCVACINNRSFANLNDLQNFVLHSVPDGESGA